MAFLLPLSIALLFVCSTKCENLFNPDDSTENDFLHSLSKRQTAQEPFAFRAAQERSGVKSSDHYTFLWNKNQLSPYEYHLGVCTDRCLDGRLVRLNSTLGCPNIVCFPCDCETPKCEIYDTCCPDLLETGRLYRSEFNLAQANGIDLKTSYPYLFSETGLDFVNSSVENEILTCGDGCHDLWKQIKPRPVCRKAEVGPSYLQIKSCPKDYANEKEKVGCEKDFSAKEQSTLKYQHIADNSTGASYYNDLCAACNQVYPETRVPWSVEIECNHFMHVYNALDSDSFLRQSLQSGSTCTVYQVPPGEESCDTQQKDNCNSKVSTKCRPHWYGPILSSCNITGLWKARDADIEAACTDMDHQTLKVFDRRQNRGVYFKNIFCAICNTGQYPWFYDTCEDEQGDGQVPVSSLPFSLLLGTKARSPMRKVMYSPFAECPASQWAGPDGLCYPLQCAAGKVLDLDEKVCKAALPGISGLGYSLELYYRVKPKMRLHQNSSLVETGTRDSEICKLYSEAFKKEIRRVFSSLSATGEFSFSTILKSKTINDINKHVGRQKDESSASNDTHILYPSLFALRSHFIDNKQQDRDEFERAVIDQLINTDLNVSVTDDHVLVLSPETVLEGYDLYMECSSLTHHLQDLECCSGRIIRFFFGIEPEDSIWSTSEKFLPLNPLLRCPFISFNNTQYTITADMAEIPPSFNVSLTFDEIEFNFSLPYERNMLALDTKSLIVCFDVLQSKVSEMSPSYLLVPEEENEAILLSQYILTMICQGLSVLCLILTLMTYFLFASLRSAAGMNNIFLCLSLLFAQAFLLVAAHVKSSGPFCKIVGIATHFFWLCMFCWSFVCCFHMYRIFTSKIRKTASSARSMRFELLRKALLCALFPILTVIAVVVYNIYLHDKIGYGKDGCFLDSSLLILVTVIAPLSLVLLCNIFFFCSTVWKIHSVRKLQSGQNLKKDDRQNLYIYIKLSSMTGAFWVVSILAETLDNEPLRYISIVLNGLQGMFIFISYIANRRVFNMYLRAVGLEEYIPATSASSTDRSTLAKAASEVNKKETSKPESESGVGDEAPSTNPGTPARKASIVSKDSGCRDGDTLEGEDEMPGDGEGERPVPPPAPELDIRSS